jgi:hypothetical protein
MQVCCGYIIKVTSTQNGRWNKGIFNGATQKCDPNDPFLSVWVCRQTSFGWLSGLPG